MSAGGKSARKGEGTACKDAIVFFVFFRPPDERKNLDWSELINYLIHPSDWSRPVIQNPKSLLIFIFNKADKSKDCFKLILD